MFSRNRGHQPEKRPSVDGSIKYLQLLKKEARIATLDNLNARDYPRGTRLYQVQLTSDADPFTLAFYRQHTSNGEPALEYYYPFFYAQEKEKPKLWRRRIANHKWQGRFVERWEMIRTEECFDLALDGESALMALHQLIDYKQCRRDPLDVILANHINTTGRDLRAFLDDIPFFVRE